jgi:periplasmic copper chaperone A
VSPSKPLLLLLALAAPSVLAADFTLKGLAIDHPYARSTPPGAMAGAAYLTIENKGAAPDKLVAAASAVAKVVEIHEMAMEGGVMKMRAVNAIEVKPGAKAELKPGGYHIMLMGLTQPLKAGAAFPLTLVFEKAGKVEVSVRVEDMAAGAAHPMH